MPKADMHDMIHITTAANKNYALGMLLAVSSALDSLDPEARVTVHLLNGGISAKSLKHLQRLCNTIHPHCTLVDVALDETLFKGAILGPGNSYMTYARLVLSSLIRADKVIYFDADMLILKNLAEVWELDMQGKALMGTPNHPPTILADDCPVPLLEVEKSYTYINGGFLVVDLDRWRRNATEATCLAFATENRCNYWDQTVLNYVLRNDILVLDQEWNWQSGSLLNNAEIVEANLHYPSRRKPWHFFNDTLKDKIWRFYYRKFIGGNLWHLHIKNDFFDFMAELKKLLIRRSSLVKRVYTWYLKSKNKGVPENIINYYTDMNLADLEDLSFNNYVASLKGERHE